MGNEGHSLAEAYVHRCTKRTYYQLTAIREVMLHRHQNDLSRVGNQIIEVLPVVLILPVTSLN